MSPNSESLSSEDETWLNKKLSPGEESRKRGILNRGGADDYPQILKTMMPASLIPSKLYIEGNKDLLKEPGIGFCGSRESGEEAVNVARDCAQQAVREEMVVISGHARGIDLTVHFGALEKGGKTILVLAEGLNHFRPRSQLRDVWDWQNVLVVSQFKLNDPWKAYRAMERNGLIVGLSRSIVVIRAGEKGGTLDAGDKSLKARRPLFVIWDDSDPVGNVESMPELEFSSEPASSGIPAGNKKLVRMGAEKLTLTETDRRVDMDPVFERIRSFNPTIPPRPAQEDQAQEDTPQGAFSL